MLEPLFYAWSRARPCRPRDNIKICPMKDPSEVDKTKNFIKMNIKAVKKAKKGKAKK